MNIIVEGSHAKAIKSFFDDINSQIDAFEREKILQILKFRGIVKSVKIGRFTVTQESFLSPEIFISELYESINQFFDKITRSISEKKLSYSSSETKLSVWSNIVESTSQVKTDFIKTIISFLKENIQPSSIVGAISENSQILFDWSARRGFPPISLKPRKELFLDLDETIFIFRPGIDTSLINCRHLTRVENTDCYNYTATYYFINLDRFKQSLHKFHNEGYRINFITNATYPKETILSLLQETFFPETSGIFRHSIYVNRGMFTGCKGNKMQELIRLQLINEESEIVFIDDLEENLSSVKKYLPNVKLIHAKGFPLSGKEVDHTYLGEIDELFLPHLCNSTTRGLNLKS